MPTLAQEPEDLPAEPADLADVLKRLLGSPNLGSRRAVYRRYDHMVGDNTLVPPGGDAAVIRVKGTKLGLAMTTDGNGRYCKLDPFAGGQIAVAEAARNIIATGARPLGVSDCLNFGNPDRPEIYWQLDQAVSGIAAACRAFAIPVVSGNVSLYNESETGAIDPTPVIGMVGLIDDYSKVLTAELKEDGDFVLLAGRGGRELGGSEYLRVVHGRTGTRPPEIDLETERAVHQFVLDAAGAGLLKSCHDVAEGGLLVALAECCLLGGMGVRCPEFAAGEDGRHDAAFFGEAQGRFVVSAASRVMPELQTLARRHRIELQLLGMAGGDAIDFEGQMRVPLDELRQAWESAL